MTAGPDDAQPSIALAGFWEQASIEPQRLVLGAWALRQPGGEPPVAFRLSWGAREISLKPNVARPDVAAKLGGESVTCGLAQAVPIGFEPMHDLSNAALVAEWADGARLSLAPLGEKLRDLLRQLRFETYEDFEALFQNPAFRAASPALQAYGAVRAMRIAGPRHEFWLAGAVVAIYRMLEHDAVPRAAVERAIGRWKRMQAGRRTSARGLALRWATSMHLAAGYAHLAWGDLAAARDEFLAMSDYTPRLATWPQCLTNLGIGRFLAAWLTLRLDDAERAAAILEGTEAMFPAGVAPLRIWNFHMYEELRGALKIWQYCFVFKKKLEGEQQAHVLPPGFVFPLRNVSAVMRLLVERGLVPDWRFPDDLPAQGAA
jgi:hypothetical protein